MSETVKCPRCNGGEELTWCMLCEGENIVESEIAAAYTLRFGEEWPDSDTVWRFTQRLFYKGEPCLPETPEIATFFAGFESTRHSGR